MSRTLTEKLAEIAKAAADQVAMLHETNGAVREVTYEDIYTGSLKVANRLCKSGVQKGDRVAILMENRPEWSICYFGILFSGAVAVPLDAQLSPEQMRYSLEKTRAKVAFASGRADLKQIAEQKTIERIIVIGESDTEVEKGIRFNEILAASEKECALPQLSPQDIASIIFTSGTTGPPKGVMLTHANFYSNFLSLSKIERITADDNFLSILPLYHVFPFMVTLIVPLFLGARITYIDTLRMESIRRSLTDRKVTMVAVTPQVLAHFHRGIRDQMQKIPQGLRTITSFLLDFSWRVSQHIGKNPLGPILARLRAKFSPHLRYFISGGAKLDENVERAFFRLGFGVIEGYGLTETSPVVTMNPPKAPKIGSAGKPVKGVEVRIANSDGDGVGEILIKGRSVMKGYFEDEKATREVFEDDWFHTGDLGTMDEDGYLFVRGRLKDIIVLSSGKNVSSEEVKEHYLKAPSIKEIHIMAAPRDEKLAAVIVPDFNALKESGISDIHGKVKRDMEHLSASLESYKRVRDFVLTSRELPKTRLGKVERHKAEEIYHEKLEGRRKDERTAVPEEVSEVGERVIEILARETGRGSVKLSDHLELDLGFDSLSRVELMAALERELGIKIDEERFNGIFRVEELTDYIERIQPGTLPERGEIEHAWEDIFRSEPPARLAGRIGIDSGRGSRMATTLASLVLDSLFKLVFRLETYGKEHLRERSFLICPNHASYLDAFAVFSSLPVPLRNRLFFMAFRPYFEVPVIRRLIRLMRIIPVESSRNLVEAMQASSLVLRSGNALCIFPEGEASLTGEIADFKKGVAILAKNLGLEVVPVYIGGSYEAWKPGTFSLKPHRIRVLFGKPLFSDELERKGQSANPDAAGYKAVSLGLREEVLKLKDKLDFCESLEAGTSNGAMDACMGVSA